MTHFRIRPRLHRRPDTRRATGSSFRLLAAHVILMLRKSVVPLLIRTRTGKSARTTQTGRHTGRHAAGIGLPEIDAEICSTFSTQINNANAGI